MTSYSTRFRLHLVTLILAVLAPRVIAETLYVDGNIGNDLYPGSKEKPLKTLTQVALMVNRPIDPGPTTVKIAPGIHSLTRCVVFENTRPYTEQNRLVIEATVLPDDPNWTPALMPVILSAEDPREPNKPNRSTETYSLKVKLHHVTIRGLKFLGNPLVNNWHCCIERTGRNLDDLLVTQCMFVGQPGAMDIYCAALATGDRFVLDHNIFYNCNTCAVFWDGPQSVAGKACAMRYCIVDGASAAGVWTCRTKDDFEFHHNIITRSEYFWMRRSGDQIKYQLHDCVVTNNKYFSGYGVETGPIGQTGTEVSFEQKNVIKYGNVTLIKDKAAKNFLHVAPKGVGSELGAGLFTK